MKIQLKQNNYKDNTILVKDIPVGSFFFGPYLDRDFNPTNATVFYVLYFVSRPLHIVALRSYGSRDTSGMGRINGLDGYDNWDVLKDIRISVRNVLPDILDLENIDYSWIHQ